jgi:hypothetical protein
VKAPFFRTGLNSDRPNDSTPLPVNTPDVQALSFTIDNGVKVFQLTAEPVKRKIAPWKTIDCWGFNGSCPGPTIQVNQGDRVRLILENHLPESTATHWHGQEIPYAMDGMPHLSQKPIAPGSRFAYARQKTDSALLRSSLFHHLCRFVSFSSGGLASARKSLRRGLGSSRFTERFHRNALITHFQHGQVFCTARQLKDYAVTRCRLHQRTPQR